MIKQPLRTSSQMQRQGLPGGACRVLGRHCLDHQVGT